MAFSQMDPLLLKNPRVKKDRATPDILGSLSSVYTFTVVVLNMSVCYPDKYNLNLIHLFALEI